MSKVIDRERVEFGFELGGRQDERRNRASYPLPCLMDDTCRDPDLHCHHSENTGRYVMSCTMCHHIHDALRIVVAVESSCAIAATPLSRALQLIAFKIYSYRCSLATFVYDFRATAAQPLSRNIVTTSQDKASRNYSVPRRTPRQVHQVCGVVIERGLPASCASSSIVEGVHYPQRDPSELHLDQLTYAFHYPSRCLGVEGQ